MNKFCAMAYRTLLFSAATWVMMLLCAPAGLPEKLMLPPGAQAAIDKIYSFDMAGAIADARRVQEAQPDDPLGYLLEAEALWWKMWCTTAEFKYGMTNAWRRSKIPADERYLELSTKASSLAQARLKERAATAKTAEMHLYAGLGDAFAARLYGVRGENRATARLGVRAREHFLRATQLDPDLTDAQFGLGLYNYYVDTLSALAKFLGFFMGLPGGSKQEGIRQLERAMTDGVLTPDAARFYLTLNLHRYDEKYEQALRIVGPLVEKYPSNPLFLLARGDLYGKLARKEQAVSSYKAAAAVPVEDPECRNHIQELVRASLAAQGIVNPGVTP